MSLPGKATFDGTARYRGRFAGQTAINHFRTQQGLVLSSIGIGTYLGNADERTDTNYTTAVVRAVQLGANVIDSAANYRFQRSERSIGAELLDLTEKGFGRDEIVICTKGGYLPFNGQPPRDVRGYVEDTFVRPGVAHFEDFVSGSHCMTPAYLQNQLDQSLENMGIDSVDVYYIHNPESQLGQVTPEEFYYRLGAAFERLEQNRKEGRLSFYGVATWNGFRATADSSSYHSLERMVALAKDCAGPEHGFRFVQLPYNLAMTEALTLKNQIVGGVTVSTLEAASELGITAIASASMLQGRVARGLTNEIRRRLGSLRTDAQTAIQFVRSTPGITTALVGMSDTEHVNENLEIAAVEPVDEEQFAQIFG